MSGGSPRRYPPELRERAVRMVAGISDQPTSNRLRWGVESICTQLIELGVPIAPSTSMTGPTDAQPPRGA